MFNLLWKFIYAIGHIFLVTNGQIWENKHSNLVTLQTRLDKIDFKIHSLFDQETYYLLPILTDINKKTTIRFTTRVPEEIRTLIENCYGMVRLSFTSIVKKFPPPMTTTTKKVVIEERELLRMRRDKLLPFGIKPSLFFPQTRPLFGTCPFESTMTNISIKFDHKWKKRRWST